LSIVFLIVFVCIVQIDSRDARALVGTRGRALQLIDQLDDEHDANDDDDDDNE
jgi:hypothetical protein